MSRRRGSVSPFFCFVRDQLPELRRRGLPVARVVDAIPHCHQAWATHNLGDPVPASLTKKMPSVTSLPDALAVSWNNDEAVVTDIFYFLDIYSHGKLPSQCELRFLPCEIGCVRYSLQDGITADFHHFIEPEAPPRGFRYHCQAAGAETHKIPISGFHLPRTCYAVVLQELLEFAQPATGVQPRFFCRSNDRFRISWCLGRMATVAGIESSLQLFAVEDLIVELYLKKFLKEPSKTWVSRKLDVCLWDFSSNTRCKWHEENDIICCALASCKKIAYCISRSLANVYGVPLTAAHLPLGVSHCDQSTSTRIVKLDAGWQKTKAESSGYDRPFGAPSRDRRFIPSNRDSPCGVKTLLGVKEVSYREEKSLHF
ncbi:protein maelstrom homolog isoform X4 [Pseudopipra pipra]|uniref:protein maelstrom homolog isoform X4 n=1 Tax=Pseudopipra pipra TaxID=415032 RepID=UPI003138E62C